jgi:hypothetical protein
MRENRLSYNELFIVSNREVKMKLPRVFLMACVVVMVVLLSVSPGLSKVKTERAISFSAYIAFVSQKLEYVVMREARLFISGAEVVDERGAVLTFRDLKPGLFASVEGIENSRGAFAKKITLKKPTK